MDPQVLRIRTVNFFMSYLVEIALSQKEPRYKVIDVQPKKVRIR